ncbi:response regulator [Roseomonas elaeocarpi]|uniref:histidine kinase n=1 Tax=Roseomonas elaeocarpi TaxID=907779 RepID=A0ABV6JPP0_9PROT
MSEGMTAGEERGTILLVDDEAEIVTALYDLFEDDYEVLSTTSPSEALSLLHRHPDVAVILSDQRMPGMNGDQMLAAARAHSRAEALLLTGYADLDAVVSALNKGRIAGYSPKPWDPVALRGMVSGAHERWRLARALEKERSLLHGLLDHSPDRISFKDAQGRFIRLNAAKAASLGSDPRSSLGKREEDLAGLDATTRRDADRAVFRDARPTEEVASEEGEGGARFLSIRRVPILQNGKVEFLATVEHDVTEQRELEGRVRQAEKMQALGTMAGGIAHDFNNLLTAVIGNLQLASRRLPEEDGRLRRQIHNATRAAERGATLTQRLLSFTRQRDLDMQDVDVNALIVGMEDLLLRSLGGLVSVTTRLAAEAGFARIDPGQLELALLNLCINARDAMPGGGRILVETRGLLVGEGEASDLSAGRYVVVTVQDEGQGMSPDVLGHAFEPFFTTKDVGKGTGLGLSMVYGFMRQAGGAVRMQSTEGVGTTVELFLPSSRASALSRKENEEQGAGDNPIGSLDILVVDDDAAVREVTVAFLRELGHRVVAVEDGSSALHQIGERPGLDLIIVDLAMPSMSGSELAEEVRRRWPGLPVLLMTGFAKLGGLPGSFVIMHKPFTQENLQNKILEVMSKG